MEVIFDWLVDQRIGEKLIELTISLICLWSFAFGFNFAEKVKRSLLQDDGEEKDETKRKSRNLSEKKRRDEFNRLNIDLLQIEQNF